MPDSYAAAPTYTNLDRSRRVSSLTAPFHAPNIAPVISADKSYHEQLSVAEVSIAVFERHLW